MFRHGQLADIVQQRGRPQAIQLEVGKAHVLADLFHVSADAPQVLVGGLVLGFDGEGQRFDGAQVQAGHFLGMPFLIFEPAEIDAVSAIHEEQDGHQQERAPCLPNMSAL